MRTSITRLLSAFAVLSLFHCAPRAVAQSPMTTVFVVRHAEKLDAGDPDTPLSPEGEARALALSKELARANVTGVFASDKLRTQQTVRPLARRNGVDITVLDAWALDDLEQRIRKDHKGTVVLVAGHSNTVPQIVRRFSGVEVDGIPEHVYDRLYKVTIAPDGAATLEELRFGEPTP